VLPIAWVHVPKCGSSFLNTLIHLPGVCPLLPDDLVVDRQHFGLLFVWGFLAAVDVQASCPGLLGTSFGHIGIESFPTYPVGKGHFVTMLRQPEQRLISAYNDMLATFALESPGEIMQSWHSWGGWPTMELPALPDFVRWNAGCAVRMLTRSGEPCGGAGGPPSHREMEEAKRRLWTGFAFVGITDQWALSICLFSAMFKVPCRADQFTDSRPGADKQTGVEGYPQELLRGVTDPYDGELYAEAMRLFEANLARYSVSEATCEPCYRQAGVSLAAARSQHRDEDER